MEDRLFIVIYRHKALQQNAWRAQTGGIFTELRMAENFIECLQVGEKDYDFRIVTGPITSPSQMAEVEAALGAF